MKTTILLVDDHALFLESIAAILSREGDFEIVGTAPSGERALPLVRLLAPDLVLLDLHLPAMDGLSCLELIRRRFPAVKVAMLTGEPAARSVDRCLAAGACGYILKSINPRDLPSALRHLADGTFFAPAPNGEKSSADALDLNERELAVLDGVARGLSNRRIAETLWITEKTVKFHLTKIYRKLGVDNRTEAARAALREGLVPHPLLDGP